MFTETQQHPNTVKFFSPAPTPAKAATHLFMPHLLDHVHNANKVVASIGVVHQMSREGAVLPESPFRQ